MAEKYYVLQSKNRRVGRQNVVLPYHSDPDTKSPYIPVIDGITQTRSESIARAILLRGFDQVSGPKQIAIKLVPLRGSAPKAAPKAKAAPKDQPKKKGKKR